MALLDADGRARVEQVIADVERSTRCEIVVLEVGRAEPYGDLRLLYAAGGAFAAAVSAHFFAPELSTALVLWIELGVGLLLHELCGLAKVLRLLLPRARVEHAVAERAQLEMMEHGVLSTAERTGVLVLLSALERRVVILGDSGIHAHVQEGWQAYVDTIVAAIHAGKAADGVCEVIGALGRVLAAHLPPNEQNPNELPNAVRSESE